MLITGFSSAHSQNYTPVKNLVEFRTLYSGKSVAINSLQSDFIQEKSITMLENKIISEGSFIYKRNNKLRMEYRKPYTFLFVMENDRVTIKNNQQKSSVSTNSNKLFKMISQMTIDCVTGNVLNSKDFDIEIFENTKVWYLVLKPRLKLLKSLFETIDILISKNDFTVERIELKETSGDNTTLIFSNKKINIQVNDEVFQVN
ncbi:MAG: outer membrane lipoprotein carrier protein LolA [Bacteroidota bacterium]